MEKGGRTDCKLSCDEVEKRRAARVNKNTPEQDKSWASREDCFFPYVCGAKLAVCQRRSRMIAAKDRDDG